MLRRNLPDANYFSAVPTPDNAEKRFEVPEESVVLIDLASALLDFGDLQTALIRLARNLGAVSARVIRIDNRSGVARIAVTTCKRHLKPDLPSMSMRIIGAHVTNAVAGSIWPMSESPVASELDGLSRDHSVREVLAIVIQSGPQISDIIELSFSAAVSHAELKRLGRVAPALAYAWSKRRPGIIMKLLPRASGLRIVNSDPAQSIMHPSNPVSLTRAEFRVCVLLRQGLRARAISKELGLSESTVRTHLRNLYQKTGAEGNLELMSLLMLGPVDNQDSHLR